MIKYSWHKFSIERSSEVVTTETKMSRRTRKVTGDLALHQGWMQYNINSIIL